MVTLHATTLWRSEFEVLNALETVVDRLVEQRVVGSNDAARAKQLGESRCETTVSALSRLSVIPESTLAAALSKNFDLRLCDDAEAEYVDLDAYEISLKFLKSEKCCPIREDAESVFVALVDPSNEFVVKALAMAFGKSVERLVATPSQIERLIEQLYETAEDAITEIVDAIDGTDIENVERLIDLASETPIVRLVNALISRAVEISASDIHIEPFESRLNVRYRVDGVLKDVDSPPVRSSAAVISRVKIMARLDIGERRRPQDGRIQIRAQGKTVDLRVSTVPTLHGESVVMRILDKETLPLDFGALGFDGPSFGAINKSLTSSHGILLVTGPTGSGKTTTLYAALHGLNNSERKILTVEDPIEYQIEGINQIQVNPHIELGFASALRSILRQDPDVIMLGEMRDTEAASIAVQSALTGHLVLSTLHTNDAASSVTRLLDMGIADYLITSTINGVIAQRLVRTLCHSCAEAYTPDERLIEELDLAAIAAGSNVQLHASRGCALCSGGYRGRTVIFEFLQMTETVRQNVLGQGDAARIQSAACNEGMVPLRRHGFEKALRGLTTVEEVVRVTQTT